MLFLFDVSNCWVDVSQKIACLYRRAALYFQHNTWFYTNTTNYNPQSFDSLRRAEKAPETSFTGEWVTPTLAAAKELHVAVPVTDLNSKKYCLMWQIIRLRRIIHLQNPS